MNTWHRVILFAQLMRLDRPIGVFLLGWPVMWSLWLAAGGWPGGGWLLIFVAGILCMRSAGCVVNDIIDRRIDRHVKRTKQRPLASGALSCKQAFMVLAGLGVIALFLWLKLPPLARFFGLLAFGLMILYPFTKRWFVLPQLVLGFAFSMGGLMAYAAVCRYLPVMAWYVFVLSTLWAVIYDTPYAMVDCDDDQTLGLHSSAILFGRYAIYWMACLQGLMFFMLLGLGYFYHLHGYFYVACLGCAGLFVYQMGLIRERARAPCFRAFLSHQWVGCIIWLGIWLG